ncbi:MAG TPA: FecR domain-containing protein [Pararobbsia sp.]|nr:FecR domain-containing protein [Pararobbsia sp.]
MRSEAFMPALIHSALICAAGLLTVVDAVAADHIGVVKTTKGAVHIERAGQNVDVTVGSEVFSSDRVVTGPDSLVGITLRDNTLLTEGANSVLELNSFAFNTTTYDGSLDATIRHGSLAVVDGKLAKANPDSVHYSTPTTTLGVRGTEFIIEVGGDGEGSR